MSAFGTIKGVEVRSWSISPLRSPLSLNMKVSDAGHRLIS